MNKTLFCLVSFFCVQSSCAQFLENDLITAAHYFKEAKQIAARDNKQLWGQYLYGPMIFVDPLTKAAIANEIDSAGSFSFIKGVFTGKVPSTFGVANTAQLWQGKIWTVIRWPLPKDKFERQNLVMHELYHQLQRKRDLLRPDANCSHLDRFEGRLLIKLELEALKKVLVSYPNFSREDLANAIALRSLRYQKFPGADSMESRLEENEGLAEFTGLMLSGRNTMKIKEHLIASIDRFFENPSFVRSVAYATGPVYGFLLQGKNRNWNKAFMQKSIQGGLNFEQLMRSHYHLKIQGDLQDVFDRIETSNLYNYREIYSYEKQREDHRLQLQADNIRKFIEGPVLILPNIRMNFVFNPNKVQVMEGYGPVYPTFSGKADWGSIEVTKGGAYIKDWMFVYVPLTGKQAVGDTGIDTEDWKLQLNAGWKIKAGKRDGDLEIVQDSN